MRIIPLDRTNLPAFRQYCLDHRTEHDESYLTAEDLSEEELFAPGTGPSCLLCAADGSVVRVTREEDEGREVAFIEQVAVLPACQHRGLGRALLRAAVHFGAGRGLPVCQLSVNAENKKAIALYTSEGFREKRVMICHEMARDRFLHDMDCGAINTAIVSGSHPGMLSVWRTGIPPGS